MKKKVRLREYRESDFEELHDTLSDNVTRKYFPWMYTTYKDQSMLRLKMRLLSQEFGEDSAYAIEDFWTRKYVGEVNGSLAKDDKDILEMYIIIHPEARGKGYAKAATVEYMKKALKKHPNLKKFRLEIAESNIASKTVAKKLEFDFKKYKDEKKDEKMEYWEKDVR